MGTAVETGPRTVERMALVKPSSWDETARTFEIVVSSERDVGDGVLLVHSIDAFRFPTRPVPATLDHSRQSADVWGVVDELQIMPIDGVNTLIGRGRVDGTDLAMEAAVPRLRNGSARFSVGARVYGWAGGPGSMDLRRATDWEVAEVSLVVVGMDSASIMRSSDMPSEPAITMPDEILTAGDGQTAPVERNEPAATPAATPAVEPVAAAGPNIEDVTRSAAEIKRERDILHACVSAGIPTDKADDLLRSGKPYDECVRSIFTLMRDQLSPSPAGHPARIAVTRDEGDTVERAVKDALAFRLGTIKEPTDAGRRFVRRRAIDIIEGYLVSRGVNVDFLTPGQIIDRAFHSTSDFPIILADSARKRLMAGYTEEQQTWQRFCNQRDLPDFKPYNNVQLAGRLALTKTLEGGEYIGMSLVEGKATWQLATYTGKILWTRQMIVNDDLAAFETVIMKAGRGARTTETDIIWALLTTGAVTGGQSYGGGAIAGISGQPVFAQASANTGAGTIGTPGVNTARTVMGKQKDIAGNELNLFPKFVLVPTSQATVAEQFFYAPNFTPALEAGINGPNVFAGRIEVIAENRLETRSPLLWYMVADPRQMETIEYGYLAGEAGPQISISDKRDPDGAEMLVRMDFGAAIQDFRGFYRSTGV